MTGHSEQLNELATALAKAQAELEIAEADGVGHVGTAANGRSYRYATLASVWETIRKPLTAHGLAVTQTCEPSSRGELRLTTTLLHQSGQWISGTEIVPTPVQTPQGYGSALTYARRYGLAAIVGVCVDDDDDAADASQLTAARTQLPATQALNDAQRQRSESRLPTVKARRSKESATSRPGQAWRHLPYNQAGAAELKLFARSYAKAKGLDTVTSDDIRRNFGISGKLVEYFGARTLGDILEHATAGAQSDSDDGARRPAEAA